MQKGKRRNNDYTQIIVIGLLALLAFLLQTTSLLPLRIGNANPVLLLPLLVAVCCFYGEWYGLILGLILGIAEDGVANSICFHTILFLLLGLICGALSSYVLNKNLSASVFLSFGASLVYFVIKWLWFFVLKGYVGAGAYFLGTILPSALYTALWIFPFYAFFRWLSRRRRSA